MEIAVIGSGPIGLAAAGHGALMGHKIRLFDFPDFSGSLEQVQGRGYIDVESCEENGLPSGRAFIEYVGTDIEKTLKDADVVFVAVPAYGEARAAVVCAPWIRPGQNVFLFSGFIYGSVQFSQILRQKNPSCDVGVAEMNNAIYAARRKEGGVRIGCYKKGLGMAVFPGEKGADLARIFQRIYPETELWDSILRTGFSNPSIGLHAASMVFNPRYVEHGEDVMMYEDGKFLSAMGKSIVNVLEDMDRERMALQGTGLFEGPLKPWKYIIRDWYFYQGARGEGWMEIMKSNPGLSGGILPKSFQHRFFTEDIPSGVLPLVEMLQRKGLKSSVCSAIACLASSLSGIDLGKSARTLKSLGLSSLTDEELKTFLYKGP